MIVNDCPCNFGQVLLIELDQRHNQSQEASTGNSRPRLGPRAPKSYLGTPTILLARPRSTSEGTTSDGSKTRHKPAANGMKPPDIPFAGAA